MKLSIKNKMMVGLLVIVLLLFLFGVVALQPSGGTGATKELGVSSTVTVQPASCANPQQCREIDEVWQRIGMNVRKSGMIWDNIQLPLGWKVFTAVYVPQVSGTPSGTTSASGVLPAGYCFPIERNSFKNNGNLNNWGDDRSEGERCHAGIDLLTQGEGKIVAIDEGRVIAIQDFVSIKDCKSGPNVAGKAMLIYHQNIQYQDAQGNMAQGITINYGEMDADKIDPALQPGSLVSKGQYLGQALTCGMLHFEIYNGEVSQTQKWDQNLPASTVGRNKCATDQGFLAVKPPPIMDPTNFIAGITGNFCDETLIASR